MISCCADVVQLVLIMLRRRGTYTVNADTGLRSKTTADFVAVISKKLGNNFSISQNFYPQILIR